MCKRPVDPRWFQQFPTLEVEGRYEYLTRIPGLSTSVESIASFGYWTDCEPFALMWTLDATEVVVIEKEAERYDLFKQTLEALKRANNGCLEDRFVEFIEADMTEIVKELSADHFDLAYCADVLYQIHESGQQKVKNAIAEMARVVRPSGWVIASEQYIGVEFEEVSIPGTSLFSSLLKNDPIDISHLFEEVGLIRVTLNQSEGWLYCYTKP